MIGYVTLGTNDLDRSLAFYDALLGSIGATRLLEVPLNGFTLYGRSMTEPSLAITRPYDQQPAAIGNGNMVAFHFDKRDEVDAFHARGLALGGSCEGKPGVRDGEGDNSFYAAYFRDLEGHKLCAFCVGPAES